MKVALCLSGLTRNFVDCVNTHKKFFIAPYNTDVFIHTWSKEGSNTLPHWYTQQYSLNRHQIDLENQKNTDINRIISQYSPKKILIEYPDINYFHRNFFSETSPSFFNCVMMHYSINRANNLKKEQEIYNGFKYDIVIRCRFDSYFENIDFLDTLTEISTLANNKIYNTIYLPPAQNVDVRFNTEMLHLLEKQGVSYMPNDQFAYGSSQSMDYYCSIFDSMKKNSDFYVKHPEGVLSEHLWSKNTSNIKNIQINNSIKMKIQSRYWKEKK